jgi:hypothetical protein
MFVTVGYLGTLKCRGTVYLGAEGTMERKELGSLLQFNPFCAEKSWTPLSTNKAIIFSSLRMVYFTTFVHNSPRLPLYKYQGETGSKQFVTMIVMPLYECGNTRENLQDRHLR